jgi:hypothetical protein
MRTRDFVYLTAKGPRIHGFKMTNLNDHIVKYIIRLGPNFISPELVKNIACFGQKTNKFDQNEVYIKPNKNCKKNMKPPGGLMVL